MSNVMASNKIKIIIEKVYRENKYGEVSIEREREKWK
jgi:hypothetical protein